MLEEKQENIEDFTYQTGRGITLAMLINDGIITPGSETMSFDYMGQKFTADLLPDSRIHWKLFNQYFTSPSAWAIHCKRLIQPDRKFSSASTSVYYRGKKLDTFKSLWYKKHKPSNSISDTPDSKRMRVNSDRDKKSQTITAESSPNSDKKNSVPYTKLGKKCFNQMPEIFVKCSTFQSLNRIQPFNMMVTESAIAMMGLHSHMTTCEVIGYLFGIWDLSDQMLRVTNAVPCLIDQNIDEKEAVTVECQIFNLMIQRGLVLVGWYHSHPLVQADPTLYDIETQMERQFELKGTDCGFQPCVSFITASFQNNSNSQYVLPFHVLPPPEQKPLDYGNPVELNYSLNDGNEYKEFFFSDLKTMLTFYKISSDFFGKSIQNQEKTVDDVKSILSSLLIKSKFIEDIFDIIKDFI